MAVRKNNSTKKTKWALGIARVSTSKQGRAFGGGGIVTQMNGIRKYAKDKKLRIKRIVQIEESGRKTNSKKSKIKAALNQAKSEGIGIVIVKDVDRLTRRLGSLEATLEQFDVRISDMPSVCAKNNPDDGNSKTKFLSHS